MVSSGPADRPARHGYWFPLLLFGGGFASGPFPFPLGWYWVGVLLPGLLITAASYRWQHRRAGRSTPLRGYW